MSRYIQGLPIDKLVVYLVTIKSFDDFSRVKALEAEH
jgi:hypothetical protein